jgi:hypothetical protein
MQRRAASLPRWTASYDRVAGVGAETVIELELGSGPRLLAHVGGDFVTLVAMGGHNVVHHYAQRRSVGVDLARVRPLPPEFSVGHRDPFFPLSDQQAPRRLERWWPEVSPDWLYFLDTEQARACEEIITSIEDTMLRDGYYSILLLVGGPGTGKTSILLQILRRLSNQVDQSGETWRIGLKVSDRMADYIVASTGWDLDETRRLAAASDLSIVVFIERAGRLFVRRRSG